MKATKHTYKDFVTGKVKWTRGQFSGWTGPTGPLNARYAIFRNPHSEVLVPAYCLTPETRNWINDREAWQRRADAEFVQCWPDEKVAKRITRVDGRHLFAVAKNVGHFLIFNTSGPGILDRETFRDIIAEAREHKLDMPVLIYGSIATYMGPNIEFIQISNRKESLR